MALTWARKCRDHSERLGVAPSTAAPNSASALTASVTAAPEVHPVRSAPDCSVAVADHVAPHPTVALARRP
jgi:hypothetical protein